MILLLVLISLLSAIARASKQTDKSVDTYALPCYEELGWLYEFGLENECTTYDIACKCNDPAFAPTVVNCIDQLVLDIAEVPDSAKNSTLTAAYATFSETCPVITVEKLMALHANASSLPAYNGNTALTEPGEWPVTGPFAPSREEIHNAYNAYIQQMSQKGLNHRYGAIMVGYWGCIMVLRSTVHFSTTFFPYQTASIRNSQAGRLVRRAMVRHNVAIFMLGLTVEQFLIIAGFVMLTVVFTFADIPAGNPNYFYSNNSTTSYTSAVGRRTGMLVMFIMPLFFLFAGRNNFLQWVTGWPIGPFLIFHKWIARIAVLLLFVHAVVYSVCSVSEGYYLSAWDDTYWRWGVVGFIFGVFLFVQGMRFLRNHAYDVFVMLHIVGVCIFLVSGYHHLKPLESPELLYYFYASFAVWGLDRVLRVLRVLTSGVREPAVIELKHDILTVTIKRPAHWDLRRHPGRYVFIHFWKPSVFWQSHPFTIVSCTQNEDRLKLFCKVHTGATRRIANQVMAKGICEEEGEHGNGKPPKAESLNSQSDNAPSLSSQKQDLATRITIERAPQLKMNVLLDGPYGHSHNLQMFDECVYIAGGTGIAGPFDYIQSSLHNANGKHQKLQLHWAVRKHDEVEEWFRHELGYLAKHDLVDVNIYCRATQRLEVAETVSQAIANAKGSIAIICCGPPRMIASVRNTFADSLSSTKEYAEYFEELITW